jgi:hypothetical protein
MTPTISILTVTRGEPHTPSFLHHFLTIATALHGEVVIGCDGAQARSVVDNVLALHARNFTAHRVRSIDVRPDPPVVESVLDRVIAECVAPWVLRLDDDETCSQGMVNWLRAGGYTTADVWKFNRAHLWGSADTYLEAPQLWPDHQTRLSVRAKAGGRAWIHAGSPFGGGELAPVDAAILHHKFLVRGYDARKAIGERYDAVQPGAGIAGGMRAFQLPEDVFGDRLEALRRDVAELGRPVGAPRDGVE